MSRGIAGIVVGGLLILGLALFALGAFAKSTTKTTGVETGVLAMPTHPDFPRFLHALGKIESGNRDDAKGDKKHDRYRAFGRYQIHMAYYKRAWGLTGRNCVRSYPECVMLPDCAAETVRRYLMKCCPEALQSGDWTKCAKVHRLVNNQERPDNVRYAAKFVAAMAKE
jgi:hypothetical protein